MYGENKHAPRTSVYTMSERSFEASGAGARSGIPRWSGNTLREERYERCLHVRQLPDGFLLRRLINHEGRPEHRVEGVLEG
jgi:hypothetical protein